MTHPTQLRKISSAEVFAKILHQAAGELLATGFAGDNWQKQLRRKIGNVAKNQGYCPDSAREWYQKLFESENNEENEMSNFDSSRIGYRDPKDRDEHGRDNMVFCKEQNAGARFCYVSKDPLEPVVEGDRGSFALNDVYYDYIVNEHGSLMPFPVFVEAAGLVNELPTDGFSGSPAKELVGWLRKFFPASFIAVVVAKDNPNYLQATEEAIQRAEMLARGYDFIS